MVRLELAPRSEPASIWKFLGGMMLLLLMNVRHLLAMRVSFRPCVLLGLSFGLAMMT